MKLREVLETDKEEIIKIYNEYINAEPIKGIDTFEGIRNFEHLSKMNFEEWYQELQDNKSKDNLKVKKNVRKCMMNFAKLLQAKRTLMRK